MTTLDAAISDHEEVRYAETGPTTLTLDCPRCGQQCTVRFYGPCDSCRDQLNEAMYREPREVTEDTAFVPRANVVANNVAAPLERD